MVFFPKSFQGAGDEMRMLPGCKLRICLPHWLSNPNLSRVLGMRCEVFEFGGNADGTGSMVKGYRCVGDALNNQLLVCRGVFCLGGLLWRRHTDGTAFSQHMEFIKVPCNTV